MSLLSLTIISRICSSSRTPLEKFFIRVCVDVTHVLDYERVLMCLRLHYLK